MISIYGGGGEGGDGDEGGCRVRVEEGVMV